jgi:hypothetical protein
MFAPHMRVFKMATWQIKKKHYLDQSKFVVRAVGLGRLVTVFSSRKPDCSLLSVVDKVALGEDFSKHFDFPLLIILSVLRTCVSSGADTVSPFEASVSRH